MDRYEFPSVLDCVQSLHAHTTGSSDPLQSDQEALAVAFLRMRLATWQQSNRSMFYDEAVKSLIRAALKEYDESHWTKPQEHTRPFRCECGCSVFMRVKQTSGPDSRKCITCGRIH